MTPREHTYAFVAFVANLYGVTLDEVMGLCRNRQIIRARFACYRALRMLNLSVVRIGEIMGARDHTSISHGLSQIL